MKQSNHYREILNLINRIGRLTNPRHLPILKNTAISQSQFLVLDALAEADEPLRMADLAKVAGLKPSELTRVTDELEEKEWACRTADPDDSRARLIKVTKAGAKLIAKAHDQASEELKTVWSNFTHEEWHRLTDYLNRFAEGLAKARAKKKAPVAQKRRQTHE